MMSGEVLHVQQVLVAPQEATTSTTANATSTSDASAATPDVTFHPFLAQSSTLVRQPENALVLARNGIVHQVDHVIWSNVMTLNIPTLLYTLRPSTRYFTHLILRAELESELQDTFGLTVRMIDENERVASTLFCCLHAFFLGGSLTANKLMTHLILLLFYLLVHCYPSYSSASFLRMKRLMSSTRTR